MPEFQNDGTGRCTLCNHPWGEHSIDSSCPPIKYVVEVREVHIVSCEIESDKPMNRAALLAKAHKMIEAGEQSDYLEYSHRMDEDTWTTRTEKGNDIK